jgi:hypothetical protein
VGKDEHRGFFIVQFGSFDEAKTGLRVLRRYMGKETRFVNFSYGMSKVNFLIFLIFFFFLFLIALPQQKMDTSGADHHPYERMLHQVRERVTATEQENRRLREALKLAGVEIGTEDKQ